LLVKVATGGPGDDRAEVDRAAELPAQQAVRVFVCSPLLGLCGSQK